MTPGHLATRAAAALALAALLLAALLPGRAAAEPGWERTYTLSFQECTPESLAAFADALDRMPGLRDRRPLRCSGTACVHAYTSTLAPNALLGALYAMVDGLGYRARIGVSGLRFAITCLPGRRVHPLAGEPERPGPEGFADGLAAPRPPGFVEYETPCGAIIEAAGDVLFDFDSAAIRADAVPGLLAIAARISALAPRAVEITGHTDSRGSALYNQALSERRAAAVAAHLAGPLGVPARLLLLRGLGETDPRAPNIHADGSDNPAGRAANRRVEIFLRTDAGPGCRAAAPGAFRPYVGLPHRPTPEPEPEPRTPSPRPIDPGRW